jgi:hypothetical protein
MFQKLTVYYFLSFLTSIAYAQPDSLNQRKKVELFGNIYPSFYNTYAKNKATYSSFEIYTAQIGTKITISDKIKGIVIYNVTKTTSDIQVFDSIHKPLTVNYFKGSDYTAFLKQAEILWKPVKNWEFSFGLIQSEQYLTVQDRFWGFRYIAFTLQERYQYGYPADFGFRAAFQTDKIRISTTFSNGDGPFYKQDANGLLQYALNVEYRPNKNWIFKWYGNVYPNNTKYKLCNTVFAGYKTETWKIGIEGVEVSNDQWNNRNNYRAFSAYGSYTFVKNWALIAREDYIVKNATLKNTSFSIIGVQYEPEASLQISLNQRLFKNPQQEYWQTYLSAGLKF